MRYIIGSRLGNLERAIEDMWVGTPFSLTYGSIYNPETHDLTPKKEYLQKEIGELKTEKKRLEDRISEIDKETLELQKRLE